MFLTEVNELICSRVGCVAPATQILEWANPKIHRNGRTKKWLSCHEHHDYLKEFLATRGFLLRITEVSQR